MRNSRIPSPSLRLQLLVRIGWTYSYLVPVYFVHANLLPYFANSADLIQFKQVKLTSSCSYMVCWNFNVWPDFALWLTFCKFLFLYVSSSTTQPSLPPIWVTAVDGLHPLFQLYYSVNYSLLLGPCCDDGSDSAHQWSRKVRRIPRKGQWSDLQIHQRQPPPPQPQPGTPRLLLARGLPEHCTG